jgi:hypothetical protein
MLDESEEQLANVPLTERTRELQQQVTQSKRALEQWSHTPPSETERHGLVERATSLLASATQAAERSKGPRSQKIRIV